MEPTSRAHDTEIVNKIQLPGGSPEATIPTGNGMVMNRGETASRSKWIARIITTGYGSFRPPVLHAPGINTVYDSGQGIKPRKVGTNANINSIVVAGSNPVNSGNFLHFFVNSD
jgi:hypothetical protein